MPVRRLAVTTGEPAGIGPDLSVMLAQSAFDDELVMIGDPDLLAQRARQLGLPLSIRLTDLHADPAPSKAQQISVLPCSLTAPVKTGELNPRNGHYVVNTLQMAADGCQNHHFAGLITAPVHKGVINDAGIDFTGHTEFFADAAGVEQVVMMLATQSLRVALATTHLPLKAVSDAINQPSLLAVIRIIDASLRQQFALSKPRIAVCGLNPHAGESGHLGREEIDIIAPVLQQAKNSGIDVSGPWPADTIFVKERLQDYDVVLAMYHDQGLPVLKHQGFGDAVNITLGLPFIRTSVDHGTALDLAGTGRAKASSLQAALAMAQQMCRLQSV